MTKSITDCFYVRNPRMRDLFDISATLEPLLEDHSAFFEGPVWIDTPDGGHLLFTDIAGDAIFKWLPNKGRETVARNFVAMSPGARSRIIELHDRKATLRGPDGLALDAQGRIVYCGYGLRNVGRLELDGSITVLASSYEGRRLNTPNDVVISRNGGIYFTDSSADISAQGEGTEPGVPTSAIYRIGERGLERLDADFTAANGLVFSPDESHLYVNDTRRMVIWRFEVAADGTLKNRVEFAHMGHDHSNGHPDGMKVDVHGNVYATGPGGLWILAPDGGHLGTVRTPERLTNLAFGGADRNTLFMTGPSFLWQLQAKAQGLRRFQNST